MGNNRQRYYTMMWMNGDNKNTVKRHKGVMMVGGRTGVEMGDSVYCVRHPHSDIQSALIEPLCSPSVHSVSQSVYLRLNVLSPHVHPL